ncbi:MAG: hypothetical protein JWM31_2681 [Solirubrobacterales bacterium]|nr:hypothetical protein [Solirubrobacterales bacterium]
MMEPMEQHRHERVVIETARHRIEGTLTLARDGYRSRVSDVLNATERDFVSLTDVSVGLLDDPHSTALHPFLIVSRLQIVLAVPLDAGAGPSSPPPLTSV